MGPPGTQRTGERQRWGGVSEQKVLEGRERAELQAPGLLVSGQG